MKPWTAFVLLALAFTGCTTISSTMLNRTDQDNYYNNGHHTKGVPITLKVPTHVDVRIVETYILENKRRGDEYVDLQPLPFTCRTVHTEVIETDKVFTVDFKRPASGTLDYQADFENQYFSKINNKLEDTTIRDTADLVASAATLFGIPTMSSDGGAVDGSQGIVDENEVALPTVGSNLKTNMLTGTRLVAYQRFDINSCDFEQRLSSFVNLHLSDGQWSPASPTPDPIPEIQSSP